MVSGLQFWAGRNVFVTGHTGFKGSWLALWLHRIGASVNGYALAPPSRPSLFEVARLSDLLASDSRADLAEIDQLRKVMKRTQPEVVFHLAAQSLVRESYRDPLGTLTTNILGTANLLQAVREVESVRAVIIVTTDKVYDNREWVYPYREVDPLGGSDPYSASKACAEIVTASFRTSFLAEGSVRVATARAGNVIGGGDWSQDRLLPDCLIAFQASSPVRLRCPQAVRPWQHVLEPLSGYLLLAERLLGGKGSAWSKAWNFGPDPGDNATVGEVCRRLVGLWGNGASVELAPDRVGMHEAGMLRLDSALARAELGWSPRWNLDQALAATVDWHRAWLAGRNMQEVSLDQLRAYEDAA